MQRLVASSQEQETLKLKPLKPRVYSRPNDYKQFEMGFQSRMEDFLGEFKRIHPKRPFWQSFVNLAAQIWKFYAAMLGTCDKISVGDALLTPVQECVALTAWPIEDSCSGFSKSTEGTRPGGSTGRTHPGRTTLACSKTWTWKIRKGEHLAEVVWSLNFFVYFNFLSLNMLKPKNLKFWSSLPRSKTNTPWAFSFHVFSATKYLEDDDFPKSRGKKNRWRWWGCGWSLQAFDLQKKKHPKILIKLEMLWPDGPISGPAVLWNPAGNNQFGCFRKEWHPKSSISMGGFPLLSPWLRYPYFWKHPNWYSFLCKEVGSTHQDADSMITTRMRIHFFLLQKSIFVTGWVMCRSKCWWWFYILQAFLRGAKKTSLAIHRFFLNGWFKTKTQVLWSAICVFFFSKLQQKNVWSRRHL